MWRSILIYLLTAIPALAQDITGDLNTNVGAGATMDSNNTSSVVNYNGAGSSSASPVMSAVSPTVMGGGGNDSCLIPNSQGIQLSIMGMSQGRMEQDPNCNRRKDSRLLGAPTQVGGLGLQVSGISLMCSDPNVFKAMLLANTPCPVFDVTKGRLAMGQDAIALYRGSPDVFVVGYQLDKGWWDAVLLIGQEIEEDVEEVIVDDYVPLSERCRSSGRDGRADGAEPDQQPDAD